MILKGSFYQKHVCTVSNQTHHALTVGVLALLIDSGHSAPTMIEKSAMNQNEGLAIAGMRNVRSNGVKSQNCLDFERNWSESVSFLQKSLVASEMEIFLMRIFLNKRNSYNFCSVS